MNFQAEEDRLEREYSELNIASINGDDLGNEVKQHAELFRRCTQNSATAKRLLAHWIRQKAKMFGSLCTSHRDELKAAGDKYGDKVVEQFARSKEEYIGTCTDVEDAEYLVDRWNGLVSAYQSRGFQMRDLVRLALSSMGKDFIKDDDLFPARPAYTPSTSTDNASAGRRGFPSS